MNKSIDKITDADLLKPIVPKQMTKIQNDEQDLKDLVNFIKFKYHLAKYNIKYG